MVQASRKFLRVTPQRLCLICGKPTWCLVAEDGSAAICPRISEGSTRDLGEAGFLHLLGDWRSLPPVDWQPPVRKPPRKPYCDWGLLARTFAANIGTRREELAQKLGVSVESLERLGTGFNPRDLYWSFPERDGRGQVIGILRRLLDGTKRRMAGSQNGLCYPLDWDTGAGPVLLVEGPSDTAALLTMGLTVVGRPSNRGGADFLADLLAAIPPERSIIVIGERDEKTDGRWPGKEGAVGTAEKLVEKLDRPIGWSLPPDGAKDSRAWLNQSGVAPTAATGERFLAGLEIELLQPTPVLPSRIPNGPVIPLDDWRLLMTSRRIASLHQSGLYLDASPTGAGKSHVDCAAICRLFGRETNS